LQTDQFERLVDQQMCPGTIDCLQPADDPFLEVKTALSPSKNLRQRRFAFL